ncbi:hypothetical protein [Nocardia panacis]|nr:hypothetical protein [Nocardia panacis]
MTSIEPPHGISDLSGQVGDIEAERAELAAERARLEAEKALVRQRRIREDQQPAVLDPSSAFVPEPARSPVQVIDSAGEEFETDVETGDVIRDTFGQPIPRWRHQTVDLDGELIQVRKPSPMALQAFSMAASRHTPDDLRQEMTTLFVRNHISPLSYGRLLTRMMNPDGNFTVEDFGRIFELIATLDTARPTGPSQL